MNGLPKGGAQPSVVDPQWWQHLELDLWRTIRFIWPPVVLHPPESWITWELLGLWLGTPVVWATCRATDQLFSASFPRCSCRFELEFEEVE